MNKVLRRAFLAVLIALPVLVALTVGVAAVNRFAGPLPPRTFSMSTGREGGAHHQFALEYRRLLAPQGTDVLALTNDDAEARLRDGRIGAALFVISPRAPIVDRLLRHPAVELMSERRHRAYTSHYAYLTSVTLGEGMVDLARDVPG